MKRIVVILSLLVSASLGAQRTLDNLEHIYQVKKGDTAYRIALNHGITLEQLIAANPEIGDGKVKKGMFLNIPSPQKQQQQQPSPAEAQVAETVAATQPTVRRSYDQVRVAVLLPFEEKSVRAGKFLEFYQGFLMAVDSVSRQGTDVEVYALNTGATAADIRQVLHEPELESMQLIIGPADQAQVPDLSAFCQEHGIRLVLPFSNLSAQGTTSSTVYSVTPPTGLLQQRVGEIMASEYSNRNYVVLNTETPDEKGQNLIEILRTQLGKKGIAMRSMNINGDDSSYESALNAFRENCIVPDNASIKTLNIFFSRIKSFAESHPEYQISLLGYPEWQTYTSTLLNDFYAFDTYLYTSYYRNPMQPRTTDFERKFYSHFGKEMLPTYPCYGMLGFDLGYYFMNGMARLGDTFDQGQAGLRYTPFQHAFSFKNGADTAGYINQTTLLIHYTPSQTIEMIQ